MKFNLFAAIAIMVAIAFSPACSETGSTDYKTKEVKTAADSMAYSLGANVGGFIAKDSLYAKMDMDLDMIFKGLYEAVHSENPSLTDAQVQRYMMQFQQKQQQIAMAQREEQGQIEKEKGEKFLAENKNKPGVKTTESGLQYKVIEEGSGESPAETDKVKVHYTGRFIDGEVFDSSVERGQPAVFGVNQVISGWTEALKMMKPGAKWELYIPGDIAYGPQGRGNIPPNAVLVFEVELIEVNPAE